MLSLKPRLQVTTKENTAIKLFVVAVLAVLNQNRENGYDKRVYGDNTTKHFVDCDKNHLNYFVVAVLAVSWSKTGYNRQLQQNSQNVLLQRFIVL